MIYFEFYLLGFIITIIYLKLENYYLSRNEFDFLDIKSALIIAMFSWLTILFLILTSGFRFIKYICKNKISHSDFIQRIVFWFEKTRHEKDTDFLNFYK